MTTRSTDPLDKRAWWRAVVLLHLSLAAAITVYVVGDGVVSHVPAADESLAADGSADAGVATPPSLPAEAAMTVDAEPRRAPRVTATFRADFTSGDLWPVGAGSRDTATVAWPMGLTGGLFRHGPAKGPGAVSWLERWQRNEVRALGARVRFSRARSGAVALTAWRTSVRDASGSRLPATGMRLVASSQRWRLVVVDGQGTDVLAAGRYRPAGRSASFELVRKGGEVWVTDPAGVVTRVADPRVAALAGRWASWELRDGPRTRPAALQEIWAG